MAEIIGQLWVANRRLEEMADAGLPYRLPKDRDASGVPSAEEERDERRPVTNVVMMGMGEPLNNFAPVTDAMEIMLDDNAYGLSRRRVTLSTSGVVPQHPQAEGAPAGGARREPARARRRAAQHASCRSTTPTRSTTLLDACRDYLEVAPRDFITFEYVMLAGVNDSPAHAQGARASCSRRSPRR